MTPRMIHSRVALPTDCESQGPVSLEFSYTYVCFSCCVTCCCLIHVCELQGVVIEAFDSLLSRKECFQSLPTSTGTQKKCVEFPLRAFHGSSGAVPREGKKCIPSWLRVTYLMWEEICVCVSVQRPAESGS